MVHLHEATTRNQGSKTSFVKESIADSTKRYIRSVDNNDILKRILVKIPLVTVPGEPLRIHYLHEK